MKKSVSSAFEEAFFTKAGILVLCEWCGTTHFATGQEAEKNPEVVMLKGGLEGLTSYDVWPKTGIDEKTGKPYSKELIEMRKKVQSMPDQYVEHKKEAQLHFGVISAKVAVLGCCDTRFEPFEKSLWNDRFKIVSYLEARAAIQMAGADHDQHTAEKARGAVGEEE